MESIDIDSYYFFITTNKDRTLLKTDTAGNLGIKLFHIEYDEGDNLNPLSGCIYLIYWEKFKHPLDALSRKKCIDKWSKKRKVELVSMQNSEWKFYNELVYTHPEKTKIEN